MILTPEQLTAQMIVQTAGIDVEVMVVKRVASEAGANAARSHVPVFTGATLASISADEDGFGAGTDYAPYIEYGTAYIAPQPFIEPASGVAEAIFTVGVLEAGTF